MKCIRNVYMKVASFCALHKRGIFALLFFGLFSFSGIYAFFIQPPTDFEPKSTFTIEEGATISSVADQLEVENYIRSPFVFKIFMILSNSNEHVVAGDYYFHHKQNVFTVTKRLASGDYGLTPIVVRIPEGSTVYDIAILLDEQLDRFSAEKFIARAEKEKAEGYLFPDTYLFLPNATEKRVYETLRDTFNEKIRTALPKIQDFDITLHEAIIMASIIEKESSQDQEERRTISGILWNRINIDMPLQVDATFNYINGKNTFELSTDDLAIDSPYNTYVYPGLPIGPISNPSLDSIIAAVTPIENDYLFYLHDMSGNVYYSFNFEQHKSRKFEHLR